VTRLILRTQARQSTLAGKPQWCENPDDYAVVLDGPVVGRIYKQGSGTLPHAQWRWCVQAGKSASGYAATLEEAQAAFAEAFNPRDER
jgi:hypothetical protein